jgi:hypothetical protein
MFRAQAPPKSKAGVVLPSGLLPLRLGCGHRLVFTVEVTSTGQGCRMVRGMASGANCLGLEPGSDFELPCSIFISLCLSNEGTNTPSIPRTDRDLIQSSALF